MPNNKDTDETLTRDETTIKTKLKTLKKRNKKLKQKADTLQTQMNILNQAIASIPKPTENTTHNANPIEEKRQEGKAQLEKHK